MKNFLLYSLIFLFSISLPAFANESGNFGFLSEGIGISPKAAKTLGIEWLRPHPGTAVWNNVEPESGNFYWDELDDIVKNAQKKDLQLLITIWPYADWDQETCHKNGKEAAGFEYELPLLRDVPCNFGAYQNFLAKLVERYDDDGLDDMAGLKYKIKYWEVLNEPEFNSGGLVFFQGTADEYYQILKVSHEAIKSADKNSKVVLAGMAGTGSESQDFWAKVFNKDIKNYFDIGNIHSITSSSTSLNTRYYQKILAENKINKPYWLTEVQITGETQASDLVKGYVHAFKAGTKKIFYTIYQTDGSVDQNLADSALIYNNGKKTAYFAMQTLIKKIDGFSGVKKIAEGQYRFIVKGKKIYVVWGSGSVAPAELQDKNIIITNLQGEETAALDSSLTITEEPVFIEIVD